MKAQNNRLRGALLGMLAIGLTIAAAFPAAPGSAQQTEAEDGGFTFTIPTLPDSAPLLQNQLESLRDRARSDYDRGRAELAELQSAAASAYQHSQQWTVTGRTDALIGLDSETFSYTGGAHGNTAFDALIWDVAGDRPIGILGLFANRYHGLSMIDQPFCTALRDQQRERMGDIAEDDLWADCPSLDQVAIAPTGGDGVSFTGFRVRVPPYIAGPYSAGSFDVDVPVTAEMIDALKPAYRESFALPGG
ncbi:PdaC/SigV domain-containing protein [Parasphingopyxis lamellibrachiae]|uniref:Uncharacterized protein DUF4163 n=1 Tax=Parasphingopyxis lamellibrachiae TaxID=680125 RepID=A0A3D9FDP3_9SPHN|nr:DUF4163 domain-containing protein [Parasphingopyxis lamellibrachiae]RED15950.1 uncharacterized protein DUF4163 [Parasphingopyxis lamellibrachiae]